MKSIQIYDPPMCCSTGICGPSVDPALVQLAADLEWIKGQGYPVQRYNLAQSPMAFVENPTVRNALETGGEAALPLIVADGQVLVSGRYPSRQELLDALHDTRMNAASESLRVHEGLGSFIKDVPRFLFFTGKGGVGKTSLACATAIALADRGQHVLLVSTDPASNLDEVLGQPLAGTPTPVAAVQGLYGLNIDPATVAQAYRERLVGPYRDKLPAAMIRSMEEQLSGACTMEIASFDEFARWLGEPLATEKFDHVIFDTAPTGHTLRLMALPTAWSGFLEDNTSGNSCLGPLSGLQQQRAIYQSAVTALGDATRTVVVLVSRPQNASLREAERTGQELADLGVANQRLIVNGTFRASNGDPIGLAMERRSRIALEQNVLFINKLPPLSIPLRPHNLVGLAALRALATGLEEMSPAIESGTSPSTLPSLQSLTHLVDELQSGGSGVIMTMGKGGVGKTTIAAAIASELARRGHKVHLSTTDPAAHVAAVAGHSEGLEVSRIDPVAETRNYVQQVMESAGKDLDEAGRALLEEDLRSPCTEEIAVFRAFARTVAQGKETFVVLDTAPTGHTLLLLDATESYHREIARKASNLPEEVRELLPRLRDAAYTRVLVITLPEATPVHEAAALQDDLRRAHIEPFAWIINQSLAHVATQDPFLMARHRAEEPFLHEVADHLARRTTLVSWVPEEPVGQTQLQQLFLPTSHQNPKTDQTQL